MQRKSYSCLELTVRGRKEEGNRDFGTFSWHKTLIEFSRLSDRGDIQPDVSTKQAGNSLFQWTTTEYSCFTEAGPLFLSGGEELQHLGVEFLNRSSVLSLSFLDS